MEGENEGGSSFFISIVLTFQPFLQHLNEDRILSTISPEKDVDGCHPLHIGNLAQGNQPLFVPCTARACLHLLLDKGVELSGKYAVVIGCGNVTGLPISLLLQVICQCLSISIYSDLYALKIM